ncbi:GNAT family N-acetyltransferase [Streptacidiphilus rugosus]|uniref:GNAT family N-acetyltransferase n=1 Tax=Streptacidiphilus rugosus TaxID=405783 RepID=UPI00055B5FE3|nr:GNAT family N-acetyltransferase [Streptacidiphilus rugosus]
MTTTLRPTGPERHPEGGGRERPFAICVNGREVGGVRVTAFADGVGLISDLAVEESGRGRGRGTTAVLAAEEILRSWGCSRAEATLVGVEDSEATRRGLRWAASLGYALTARNMAKDLPASPPPLPPGTLARAMTAAEFPVWLAAQDAAYVRELVERTGLTQEQAVAKSAASHASLLGEGLDTADTSIVCLEADGEVVGTVWVNTGETRGRSPWIFDIEVGEAFRGHGHGRSLMLVAEQVTHAAGHHRLGLNVHAGNAPAERLYASLGYRTYRWALGKAL